MKSLTVGPRVDRLSYSDSASISKFKKPGDCLSGLLWLLAALLAEVCNHLAEQFGIEVKVSFDGEASGSADGFEFREQKISPLFFVSDDVPEEQEVAFLLRSL